MKAKDLAAKLLEHPDFEVTISLDVSTEEDNTRRVFGEEIFEVMVEKNRQQFTILADGVKNY